MSHKFLVNRFSSFSIQNYEARLTEDKSIAELATTTLEQPSPVSVLDATFYGEGSPSPVRKVSNSFEGEVLVFSESFALHLT